MDFKNNSTTYATTARSAVP